MSDLVEIEDLGSLDSGDLRAVLNQVTPGEVLEALIGAPAFVRKQILTKLPAAFAAQIERTMEDYGPVSLESVRLAQRAVVEALCRLSRFSQVAFDDPEDMADMVA
ncbi:FliG C-terminal domain-containing protein [Isosphaeraceae bacterium EP7]